MQQCFDCGEKFDNGNACPKCGSIDVATENAVYTPLVKQEKFRSDMDQEQIESLLHSFESHCNECFDRWQPEIGASHTQKIIYTLQTQLRNMLELKFDS